MDSEIRMIRKRFKCGNCDTKQSKLVYANETFATCERCSGIMREISENEYTTKTRDQINQNYRIVFDKDKKTEYCNRFDANDKNRSNVDGETDRKFKREENKQNTQNTSNFGTSDRNNKKRERNNSTDFTESEDNFSNMRRNYNNNNRFQNYNIYESNSGNNFRSNSPPNNNFYNYYSNSRSNNRRNENQNPYQNQNHNQNHNQRASYNRNQNQQQRGTEFFDDILSSFFPSNNEVPYNNHSNIHRSNIEREGGFFNNFFSGFGVNFPFGESPFFGRINRHNFDEDIFDQGFTTFGSSFNNFFRDNFSSNFRSNYRSRDTFYDVFNLIRNRNMEPEVNTKAPTSKEALKNLKRFKMNEKYCKKNEKGEMEAPSCPICISDVAKGEETVLLPCGHMFHSACCVEWLKKNNTCPVCRFELPPEKN